MPNDKEFELDDLESFSFDDLSLDDVPAAVEPTSGEDPFGVWVKSAPEDVVPEDEPEITEEVADEIAGLDALPEEDFLSSEELASLDDSFDFVTVSEEPLEGETPLEDEIAFLDAPEALAAEREVASEAPASFDEVSLDDFVSFDDPTTESGAGFGSEPGTAEEAPGIDDELEEDFLDIDIDIDDDIGDEELEIIEGATAPKSNDLEEVSFDTFTSQDVDLSEFGDFEEVAPVSEVPSAAKASPEVGGLPEALDIPLDIDLPIGFELPEEIPTVEEDGSFEETVLEEEIPSLDDGPVTIDLEPDDQTDLDHIMALEEDLTSGIRTEVPEVASEPAVPEAVVPGPKASQPESSDLAALILSKIEQELSSIKQEISALKQEVTNLREAPPSLLPPEPEAEAPLVEEPKPHGFFDEEDDETIALTGDELDNILSTAEISEGEEPGLTLEEDLLTMDEEGNLVDLAPETPAPEESASEDFHVTDEEFLAGTALDLNEPEVSEEDEFLGIPESIELEEDLPLGLDEDQTEDLLAPAPQETDFEPSPLAEESEENLPEPLEIPFDDDVGLELDDSVPLVPQLEEAKSSLVPDLSFESLPDLEDLPPLDSEDQGWSPSASAMEEEPEVVKLTQEEPVGLITEPAPLPPAPSISSVGAMSAGLKDELKAVLQYMDKLLASLPDDKIQEFAESEHFEVYKRLFEELGLIE